MKVIDQGLINSLKVTITESSIKIYQTRYEDELESVLIKKGQPLQELIDYLTEVNKDHLTPQKTA